MKTMIESGRSWLVALAVGVSLVKGEAMEKKQ